MEKFEQIYLPIEVIYRKNIMAFYQYRQSQKIPAGVSNVWDFISSPLNLKDITPPQLGFVVTGETGKEKMYPGMIITYIVKPLLGIRLNWMTEITHVRDNEYFIDEQRIGPYKLWHHEHKIEAIANGVLMSDIVTYSPPMGILGALANRLFISRQLINIFEYRNMAIEKRFGRWAR